MIQIDPDKCKVCGLCTMVCPNKIFDKKQKIVIRDDRENLCMKCGHCMAVCPTKAISVNGLSYKDDFFNLSNTDSKDFLNLIQSRRAIRNFTEEQVSKNLLEKIIEAISYAPPSFTPVKLEVVIVQEKEKIKKSLPHMIKFYDSLIKAMDNPIARQIIKLREGTQRYNQLTNHVVPLMKSRLPELKAGTEDTITRGASSMILFHADKNAENAETDTHIALTYGILAAHSLGLGACPIDLIPPAINRVTELRELFEIPDKNKVLGCIVLGYPKYEYKRGIKRKLKDISWK